MSTTGAVDVALALSAVGAAATGTAFAVRSRVLPMRTLDGAPAAPTDLESRSMRVDSRPHASPGRARLTRLVAIAAALVAVWMLGPWLSVVVGLAGSTVPRALRISSDRRAAREIGAAVPDTIELLVLLVTAGLTPHHAVRRLAELAPPPVRCGVTDVVTRLDRGLPLADALVALTDRLGPELAPVVDTLAMSLRHGTPIAGTLDQLSVEARLRRRRLAEADARRLPVRLSFPLVVCTLPSFVLVGIAPAVLAALSSIDDTSW